MKSFVGVVLFFSLISCFADGDYYSPFYDREGFIVENQEDPDAVSEEEQREGRTSVHPNACTLVERPYYEPRGDVVVRPDENGILPNGEGYLFPPNLVVTAKGGGLVFSFTHQYMMPPMHKGYYYVLTVEQRAHPRGGNDQTVLKCRKTILPLPLVTV